MADSSGKNRLSWFRPTRGRESSARQKAWIPPPPPAPTLRAAARSDVGRVRKNNEDNVQFHEAGIYLVCDGMGGMAAGEVASQIAVDTTVREYLHQRPEVPAGDRLRLAIERANYQVLRTAEAPGRAGMGTTLVAAAITETPGRTGLTIANVGDSRAYLLRGGRCSQLTEDHSYANEIRRVAGVRPEDIPPADLQRFGSLITRAIGATIDVVPDIYEMEMLPGDLLLLATDGLTRYLDAPEELVPYLDAADLEGSCRRLIDAANEAGGVDNTTVLLLAKSA